MKICNKKRGQLCCPLQTKPPVLYKERAVGLFPWALKAEGGNIQFLGRFFYNQLVRDQRDEFAVGRFIIFIVNIKAEYLIDVVDAAPCPGNFDRMTDSALYFAGAGVEMLGDAGVQVFGDPVDDIRIFHHHFNGFPQEMIALDVRRNSDGNKHTADLFINGAGLGA